MPKLKTLAIIGFAIFALVLASSITGYFFNKENTRLHQELIGQKTAFKKVSDRAALLENNYVTQKELNEKLKESFSKEIKALTGRIKVLSNATYMIRQKARESNQSDFSYQGGKFKYIVNEIRYNGNGPAVGYVLIYDDGRVVSKIYNHAIDVKTAIARNEDTGQYKVVSRADYILKSPSINMNGEKNWFNKPFSLPITGGTAFIDPTEQNPLRKRFHWWAPKLNASVNMNSNLSAGIGMSLAGYGRSKNDLKYKFMNVGAQYSNEKGLEGTLTPIMLRPFDKALPNTYIGSGAAFGEDGISYFFGIHFGL